MKEHLYALGVTCIQHIQYWCSDYAPFLEQVNNFYNPNNVLDILFPVISFVDSVFASQLLLVTSFGGWLNCILKWWFLEDRPYWWIQETNYYIGSERPKLLQTSQTCETGPGNPSGHTATAASVLVLAIMWISHIFNDRKWKTSLWKYAVYPLFGSLLISVMLARMFIGTHFPHQCIVGAIIGAFLAPALCIYISDPYIWQYGSYLKYSPKQSIKFHMTCAVTAIAMCLVTYHTLLLSGIDPDYTVRLAFRWCDNPDDIHVSTTPMFAMVQCTGAMLGWSMFVTPAVSRFRHDTYKRSFIVSAVSTILITYGLHCAEAAIPDENITTFYTLNFIINIIKPLLYLRVLPELSMLPFKDKPQNFIN
ncbi:unnamed protein product [Pieris brassicae]|uniref:glucose-6-phosphatase n=1 Tax=Pieris brassicae TaxID=7116 RepID=A0A9P0XC94_PIEBR|nr:unnamed protein product [Pieris brassicae]